jgi:hypothetical protein
LDGCNISGGKGLKTDEPPISEQTEIPTVKEKTMRTKTIRNFFRNLVIAGAALGLFVSAASAQTGSDFGQLKVCKVAGPGVPVGTIFTFTADSAPPFTVTAGPGPGGYCTVGPRFPVGSWVTVTETLTNGTQVTGITVNPPPRRVGSSGNSATVVIGSGITEVTFANKRTGFIEICKKTDPPGGTGNYTFYLNNGSLGPFTVPAGSCSPAIEVPAGTVTINEVLSPGVQLTGCSTLPAANQIGCNTSAGISTVNVSPGDISNQTIAYMTNRNNQACGPLDMNISTGVASWQLVAEQQPSPGLPPPPRPASVYGPITAGSAPIGGLPTITALEKDRWWDLQLCFCLCDGAKNVKLGLTGGAVDDIAGLKLNGHPIGQLQYNAVTPAALAAINNAAAPFFQPGRNCLQVRLINLYPGGARLDLRGAITGANAACPVSLESGGTADR